MLVMWQCHALMFSIYPEALYAERAEDDNENFKYDVLLTMLITWFVLGYAITLGPISWLYLAEIMTEIGMGLAVAINWLIVIWISFLPTIANSVDPSNGEFNHQTDMSPFFFIFGGWCIVSFFLINLFVKETKDLDPKQIVK